MPAHEYDSKLRAVLSYYNSVVNVSSEGDSNVSGETLEGLGMEGSSKSLFESLFGSLFRVAFSSQPPSPPQPQTPSSAHPASSSVAEGEETEMNVISQSQSQSGSSRDVAADAAGLVAEAAATASADMTSHPVSQDDDLSQITGDGTQESTDQQDMPSTGRVAVKKNFRLTDFAPDPGYFLAGAIAGGVSRTATAPLDRLKVYLLVNTARGGETAISALKQGKPIAAIKNSFRPFGDAVKDLYRAGGLRGFFAGKICTKRN